MIPVAIYIAKVIFLSGLFFGYYVLALRNERFHEWNRHYLLFSVVVSFIIPFFHWSAFASRYFTKQPLYVARFQAFTINVSVMPDSLATGFSWHQWLIILYSLVALSLLAGTAAVVGKIFSRVKHGRKKQFPLFTLVFNSKTTGPFSFFRFIFWPDSISVASREGRHILRHELAHVVEKHSLDKLWMEIVISLFWINPFFYFIRRELHIIHEFLADKKACENNEPQEYAALLVEQALRPGNMALTNSFFQKQLSRRVHMLIRENKNRFTYLKRLVAVPVTLTVILAFLFLQSQGNTGNGIPPVERLSAIPALNPKPDNAANKVFTFVETMPSFPGGKSALMSYLKSNIHYPEAARKNNIQGTIIVRFIVGTNGKLRNVKTTGSHKGGGLEQEAIRVVNAMPAWRPGRQKGQPVTVQYNLPVHFVLENKTEVSDARQQPPPPPPPTVRTAAAGETSRSSNIPDKVFTFVEQMPSFQTGQAALMKYLSLHIHYPANARENGIQGTVIVQFVVSADGTLQDVHAIGPKKGGGLEEEAMRVVEAMPAWNPGMQNGKPVIVQYNLPIRFVLQ